MNRKSVLRFACLVSARQARKSSTAGRANTAKSAAEVKAERAARAGKEQVAAAEHHEEAKQARRDKARRDAIMNCPEGKDDPIYAIELAWQSDVSSAEAIDMLQARAAEAHAQSWQQSMARVQGRGRDDGSKPSSWDRAMRKAAGVRG